MLPVLRARTGATRPVLRQRGARCLAASARCLAASHPEIKLIATDVDGTLLNNQQELQPRVIAAVTAAQRCGVPLVVATGKARGPWTQRVFPRLDYRQPGVFLQGLLIYDGAGNVLHNNPLPPAVFAECVGIAKEGGMTLTAYCGERILCEATDKYTDVLQFYREPTPEAVGPLDAVVGRVEAQKVIFMGEEGAARALRPALEARLAGRAAVTVALPGMVEVLPLGGSKGAGLGWLLRHLDVDPANVLAMGDGENDIEMLQMVGVGVAMGNAGAKTKAAAKHVVATNDDDGVAEAIERFVLAPRRSAAGARPLA